MVVAPFETICAACHAGQIAGAGRATAKGIAVLTVPGLDAESLNKAGNSIGDWPEDAEEEATPFMSLLLSRDAAVAQSLRTLGGADPLGTSRTTGNE